MEESFDFTIQFDDTAPKKEHIGEALKRAYPACNDATKVNIKDSYQLTAHSSSYPIYSCDSIDNSGYIDVNSNDGKMDYHGASRINPTQEQLKKLIEAMLILAKNTGVNVLTATIDVTKVIPARKAELQAIFDETKTAIANDPKIKSFAVAALGAKIAPGTAPLAAESPFNKLLSIDGNKTSINNYLNLLGTKFTLQGDAAAGFKLVQAGTNREITILPNGQFNCPVEPFCNDTDADIDATATKIANDIMASVASVSALGDQVSPEAIPYIISVAKVGNLTAAQEAIHAKVKTAVENKVAAAMKLHFKKHTKLFVFEGDRKIDAVVALPAPAPKAAIVFTPVTEAEIPGLVANKTTLHAIKPFQGNVDLASYQAKQADGTIEPKSAFIFPGNHGHASQEFLKANGGAGLAAPTAALNGAGIGTLSLPTVFTGSESKAELDAMVESEMAKLYKAVGMGYQLVLPVRAKKDDIFTDRDRAAVQAITGSKDLEPSFWGGVLAKPDANTAELPKDYACALAKLQDFINDWNDAANPNERRDLLIDVPVKFQQAFLQGLKASKATPAPSPTPADDGSTPTPLTDSSPSSSPRGSR